MARMTLAVRKRDGFDHRTNERELIAPVFSYGTFHSVHDID
jgi:hypothetical protein